VLAVLTLCVCVSPLFFHIQSTVDVGRPAITPPSLSPRESVYLYVSYYRVFRYIIILGTPPSSI